jgi:hypothetical protein
MPTKTALDANTNLPRAARLPVLHSLPQLIRHDAQPFVGALVACLVEQLMTTLGAVRS